MRADVESVIKHYRGIRRVGNSCPTEVEIKLFFERNRPQFSKEERQVFAGIVSQWLHFLS